MRLGSITFGAPSRILLGFGKAKMNENILKCFLLLIIYLTYNTSAIFINVYPKLKSFPLARDADVGEPLILTPLIENGKIDEARKKATVTHKEMQGISSYSGYFTVNKTFGSNMFFWFFPAQVDPKNAPVVLWLQGGPGATSMFGLFMENGPFQVSQNKTLKMRKYSWNIAHNLIYIDNPVGTGFSFTSDDRGYAVNETDVGRDIYRALIQFFQLFPELQGNDFFVTGESYAGKYVPAVSHAIKDLNVGAKLKINLKGLAIGNGLTDPGNQLVYGDYLYQLGLLDLNGREAFHAYEKRGRDLIERRKFDEAADVFDDLLNNDFHARPSLFANLTGFNFYFNYLHTEDSSEENWMSEWIQRAETRRAIHVGNASFQTENKKVEEHLKGDIMQSLAALVADLANSYRVLIYNGQLDIIVAYPLTENYLQNLKWSGADKYKSAKRKIWRVGNEIAGYTKSVENLTEALVRNAGHMVPADQPKWALDLITRFTHGKPF